MWVHNGLWLQHRARRSKERAPHLPLRPLWLDLYTSHTTQLEAFAAWCGFAEGFDLVDNLVGVVVLRAADKQVDVTTVVSLRQGDVVRVQTLGPKAVLASGAILNMYELYVY
ncbi:hypothetical protein B5M09_011267 [Aphanomyces astaci]|uniref:Uncharacterized protein n=1 Tax=Aphanomyces astaci TaxID=112090 RepID=A0A425CAG8_APHAT|nr:hypothetical protein B5M09_011267 [Aphanomyces astaci]